MAKTKRAKAKNVSASFFCTLVRSTFKVECIPEHKFLPDRKFRLDFAIVEHKIAIEQEGGIFRKGGGAHSRPGNILRDMEKSTLLSVNGWILIRRLPEQLATNETLNLIKLALKQRNYVGII